MGQEVVNESQCALLVVYFKVSTGGPQGGGESDY